MANTRTWTAPVTDRTDGTAMMTYEDMNRITENLAWLYTECGEQSITISGSIISKTTWINNDIITLSNWTEILTCLRNVYNAVGYNPATVPDNQMLWSNINQVETIEYECYEILMAYDRIPNMNHYVGDKLADGGYLRAGDDFNMGGRYE